MVKRLENEALEKYTTLKIGGTAEIMSIPDDVEGLLSEISFCKQKRIPYRILGNGSNLLVSDKGVKGFVVKLNKACNKLNLRNANKIEVGSGVMLQKFINFSINNNLYGNELLYSIPGTIGGAVFMNASIVGKENTVASISDCLLSVKIFDGEQIKDIVKKECNFNYRSSIFHKRDSWIILSALFELPSQEKAIGRKKIKERMKRVRQHQDRQYPSAGSIFRGNYSRITSFIMKGKRFGKAMYSKHNGNWINNLGGAKFRDVLFLIKMAQVLNFLCSLKKARLEIEIWR
jgi:UDP-N-acetylmuramate dehydrogenase